MNMEEGDDILITCDGHTVAGKLIMISKNQVAALLAFDGVVGGHAGSLPLTRHDAARGIYRSIIDGTAVTFQKKPDDPTPSAARSRKRST
jgi:hypothetical protein